MWLLRVLAWVGLPSWVAPLLIAGAVVGALGGAYIKGRMDSAASCRERELLAVVASMERDKRIAELADQEAKKVIHKLEEEARKDNEEIAKYAEELRGRPDKCSLTPSDVNRVYNTRRH